MKTPEEVLKQIKTGTKRQWKLAFFSAFFIGLFVHIPAMISDIPNHDGLASMYFDQNMITSGRWFLSVACGLSSYFTLPWVIGVISLVFLGCAATLLTELLELQQDVTILLVSGLLVVFPALASTFAYVFTMDGYMLAVLLAVLAVLLTKKYRWGFVGGGICLAFSMGIYQIYLAFVILLCVYSIVILWIDETEFGKKMKHTLRYLYMGIWGSGLYLVLLKVLLRVQGKELDTYQGINGMSVPLATDGGVGALLKDCYRDFAAFTLKGNVFINNGFSGAAMVVLALSVVFVLLWMFLNRKWWKKPMFFVIIGLLVLCVPVVSNVVLLISPEVTYHLLMRYQWVLFPILGLAFAERYGKDGRTQDSIAAVCVKWCAFCGAAVLLVNYAVTDNIAYSNLQKKYEKTYAYCLRLLDRIEQTAGYYQGIPIAMIGVVGDEEFPLTDITGKVTDGMIGMHGDSLLYTGANYQAFMQNYLGATLNFLPAESMADIYYSEEYVAMESFPGKTSVQVVDGVLYVKTENHTRTDEAKGE